MFRSPLFAWSPRPDRNHNQDLEASLATPATQSPSRFGAWRSNVRSMVNGSSIYSQSPAIPSHNTNNTETTPKIPFLGFWNRQQSPDPNTSNAASRESHDSRSPLRAQHSASSYIGVISNPQVPTTVNSRHPADVPLPSQQQQDGYVDPEIQQLADVINGRRHRRKKHRRRKHHRTERSGRSGRSERPDHWVRRRDEPRATMIYVRGTAARGKMIACVISGTFLITILAIYLAVALTNRSLGQEIHILFIMVLLTITIFFCHSLIRLCMLMLNPSRQEAQPAMANMTDADGFQPVVPIRVHLRRDEEVALDEADEVDVDDPEKEKLPPPPPAYGLWRSSVRVDPNLLHWQRVEDANNRGSVISSMPQSRQSSVTDPSGSVIGPSPFAASARGSAQEQVGPRPPSYASEDGVSYIIEAAPRSTVRESGTGFSDVHPAWRPGYAMSEIRGGEIPGSVDRSYRG